MPRRGFLRASLWALLLAPLFVVALSAPALADKRVALVIGNSAYRSVPHLDNPANDARLMAKTLKALGFELVGDGAEVDLDKAGFEAALQKFGNQVLGADVGLFYYAGHGVQVEGKNFLVPVEANPTKEADVFLQMIDTQVVLSQMEGAGTKLNIVLLDACRNSPFGGKGVRATGGGLAQMQAPEGTLISYATQPGNVATDGADGDSPYTKALAEEISKPGVGLFDAFNQVGVAVKKATGGVQQPWVASSPIEGSFYFAGAAADAAPTPVAAASSTPAPTLAVSDAARTADATPTPAVKTAALTPPGAGTTLEGVFKGADAGDTAAMVRLGFAYRNGDGVPVDLAQSVQWFHKAADAGAPAGMTALGVAYQNGRGVPRDPVEAVAWFRKAAAANGPGGMNMLGLAYAHGLGVPRDPVEAFKWFQQAAAGGNREAMFSLGKAYRDGDGVARDEKQAQLWLQRAKD